MDILEPPPNNNEATMSVGVVLVAICVIPMLQGDLLGPEWEWNLERKNEKSMKKADGPFDPNWGRNLEKKIERSMKKAGGPFDPNWERNLEKKIERSMKKAGGPFDPNWERNLEKKIERSIKKAGGPFDANWERNLEKKIEQSTKNSGVSIVNNMLRANINGKTYTAKLPRIRSLVTNSGTKNINGQQAEVISISINGDKSVYTTINNVTTVTDGRGNLRHDGGIFHINSSYSFIDGYVNGRNVHYDYALLTMTYFVVWFFDVQPQPFE